MNMRLGTVISLDIMRHVWKRLDSWYYQLKVKHEGGTIFVWGCFSVHCMGPADKIDGIMDCFQCSHIFETAKLSFAEKYPSAGDINMIVSPSIGLNHEKVA